MGHHVLPRRLVSSTLTRRLRPGLVGIVARIAFPAASRLAATLLVLVLASPASGADWKGRVEDRQGVAHVVNPASPMNPAATVELEELWSLGGHSEADEELFGVMRGLLTDADGTVYLLDVQLTEVRVFDAAGNYLRTIGRDGEGPGEFRRPRTIFFTPDGNIAVVQMMPGRVVMLTPEGDPAGDFSLPDVEGGGMRMLFDGGSTGQHLILLTRDQRFRDGGGGATNILASYDLEGNEVARFFEVTREMDFANFVFEETKAGFVTWAASPDGRLFTVPEWGEYEIHRWTSAGQEQAVITREYGHLDRSGEEREEARSNFVIRGPVDPKIVVSDYHPDVQQLFPRDDGTLWVLNSRGARQAPEGSLGIFDVFDADGRFDRQVTLMGEGDPTEDLYYFRGDRLYVLRHYTEAFESMVGGNGAPEDEDEEPEPMKAICYRVPR